MSLRSCLLVLGLTFSALLAAHDSRAADAGLLAGMDRSIAPGDDFFAYANGEWVKDTAIPPDRSAIGTGSLLTEVNEQRLHELLEHAGEAHADALSRKVATYYRSFMDEARIEQRGLAPLAPTLARIRAIRDRDGLSRYLGSTLRADVDILNATNLHTQNVLGLWVAQDLDDPTHYAPFLLQGGLGMPDRDYYLSDAPPMAAIRTQYQHYLQTLLQFAGEHDAAAQAATVYVLEQRIARTHETRANSGDVKRGDNHWPRSAFATRAPGMNWQAYFAAAGLAGQSQFVVWQPDAVRGIAALVGSEPLANWKAYLEFHAVNHFASYLPRAVVQAQFEFYGKTLQGTPQQRERWKRGLAATDLALGDAVGQLYVAHYFPAASKQAAQDMVSNLLKAFAARIDRLEWMAPQTKQEAKAKLAALKIGIGYPDHWRNFDALQVQAGDAYGNAQRSERFEYRRNLAKFGRPVDRSEWVMVPQLVNAVNLPAMNALNFPAAILQPPYFDPARAAALNYGSIGAIIGHEISHSFDNQGALFDSRGQLRNWWTEADFAHFQASGQQLVRQFDAYHPLPDLAINGQQTLSENIADLAGLTAAYDALRLANPTPAASVDGLSEPQQFFVSFAQSWRAKFRDPALRQAIITDGHAPAPWRAQTVRNIDAWYSAFDVKSGQALYLPPEQRVRIW